MFRVLFLMIALLAGLVAGPYLSGQQGYVRIETANNIIEMSITTLVIFFVIALAIIYGLEWIITRFLRLSRGSYNWFSRRKRVRAQKQTLEGLVKMNEGDYAKAEKLIGKNAKHSAEPVLNLIKAAEAAQQRGDEFSANRYLIEATELAGSDNLLVEIARTRILLQQNKLPAARSSVDILDSVENSGLFSTEEFQELRTQTENGLLDEKMNEEGVDGLLAWWDELPRRRRNNVDLKVGLIQRLIDCNDHESAAEFTLEILKKIGDNTPIGKALCTQITRLQPEDNSKLIKLVAKRAKHAGDVEKCCINRALGYLYVRNNEFSQAAEVFKKVIACPNQLESNDLMMASYVFEQSGDKVLAEQVRQDSLKSVMAIDNIPLEKNEENMLKKGN